MKDIHEYFNREKARQYYASKKKYRHLKNLYLKNEKYLEQLNSYRNWNALNNREIIQKKINPMYYDRIRQIGRLIFKSKAKKILDIGYGAGDLENNVYGFIMDNDIEWTAIDISDVKQKGLQKKFPRIKFIKGNVLKVKFKNKSFDLIILSEVLEHFTPYDSLLLLKKCHNILNKRGVLILSVPLNENLEKLFDNNINYNFHLREYTSELIQSELKITKFVVVKKWYLYAFGSLYFLKTILSVYIFKNKKPNLILLKCIKKL